MLTEKKVIAFDVFGTVFDMRGLPRELLKNYVNHVRTYIGHELIGTRLRNNWRPLVMPEAWEHLPPHPDSIEGIQRLRTKYIVVTCSNGPLGTLAKLSKNAGIQWDAIIPLEMEKTFKPDPVAYLSVCEIFGIAPQEMMMVTANKDFGDIEGAAFVDITPQLIRNEGYPQTIIELAMQMGC